MAPLSDYTASCSFCHQGQNRNKDQDILSNSAGTPPQCTPTCTLSSSARKTNYNTKSHCGWNSHTSYQQERSGHISSFSRNTRIHSDSRTCRSFKMQRGDILQQENRHVNTYTLTRSHTAIMATETVQKERAALPFLPLVLHPTLSSFPSWVHTVSEKGIHSWKLWWRRRRSKRVRKWRKEGGREEERTERESELEREREEGCSSFRVDGRCVRFRPSLLPLIRTAKGSRFGNY